MRRCEHSHSWPATYMPAFHACGAAQRSGSTQPALAVDPAMLAIHPPHMPTQLNKLNRDKLPRNIWQHTHAMSPRSSPLLILTSVTARGSNAGTSTAQQGCRQRQPSVCANKTKAQEWHGGPNGNGTAAHAMALQCMAGSAIGSEAI